MKNISDTLALAVCMQLSSDFDDLMQRFNIHNVHLNSHTYNDLKSTLTLKTIADDRNAKNLYDSIIRKYSQYIDILKERKYNG